MEFSYPYRPALVEETERALKSGERLTAFKILIAPSAGEARLFRLALARAGVSLVNIEAVTLRSLARLILRTVPGALPAVFWGVDAAQVIVSQCLRSLQAPADHYLQRSPATAERLLCALRVRRVNADAWLQAGGDPLVADLLVAYTAMLRRHDALDATGSLLRAAERASEFVDVRRPTLLLKLDDVRPDPGERLLVERLERLIPAVETVGLVPETLRGGAAVRIMTARDRDDEVSRALGDVLASGTPFDEVQIALAQPAVYQRRLATAASSHGIPMVMEQGVRFFDTPPGRHVRALLKWLSEGFGPEQGAACARLGLLNGDDPSPERRRDVELLLDKWPIDMTGLFSPDYAALLRSREGRQKGAVDSLMHFARKHVKELVDADGALRTDVTLPGMMRWTRNVLQHVPGRDATWTDALTAALRGRAAQVVPPSVAMPVAKAAEVLLRSLGAVHLPGDDGPPGSILVLPLERSSLSLRRKTWVLGMDDSASSGASADDTEGLPRSSMDALRTLGFGRDQHHTERLPLARMLDRLSQRTEEMTICIASYDVREARELFPHAACADRETHSRAQPVARVPVPLVPILAPGAREGIHWAVAAWRERSGPQWTEHNGILGHAERTSAASASSLERLSQCPYRYFITDLLRIRPEERRSEWLTAAERGSLMHDVFRDAHAEGLLSRADGLDALIDAVRLRLDTHSRLSPPPGPYTRLATEQELISMVRTLRTLAAEEAGQWVQTEAEWEFQDMKAGPWRLRGRIDRVDRNERGKERILDYKTGSSARYAMKNLTAMQHYLQWYVYALARHESAKSEVALSGYLFMKDGEWGTKQSVPHPLEYDGMDHLEVLAGRVDAGWFPQAAGHSDSPCPYCDVRPICGDVTMLGALLKQKKAPDEAFEDHLDAWWYAKKHLNTGGRT